LVIADQSYFIKLLPFFVIWCQHCALAPLSPVIANAPTVMGKLKKRSAKANRLTTQSNKKNYFFKKNSIIET
jgi:hypothetical protein